MKEQILSVARETVDTLGFICVEAVINISKSMRTLKVVIYKKDGDVAMDDCSSVANVIIRRLDVEIPEFSNLYDVIVESPGVDRRLKTLEDFKIFSDKEIRFVLKNPSQFGRKDNVVIGKVTQIEGDRISIHSDDCDIVAGVADFSTAKLHFDIKKYL